MKIRTGFVSNSSSTSFCLLGLDSTLLTLDSDLVEKMCEESELVCEYGLGDLDKDTLYIGVPPGVMEEDETLAQFRKRVLGMLVENYKACGGKESDKKEIDFAEVMDTMEDCETLEEFKKKIQGRLGGGLERVKKLKPEDLQWLIDGGYD